MEDERGTEVEVRTAGGLVAALEDDPDARRSVLRVRDAAGRLLVEVRDDGTVALSVAEGDLELRAERGRVRIQGGEGVHIEGSQVTVRTPHLRQLVGVLETQARRIVERAKDSYREAEGVSHVRAGQVRIVAEKTFRALAERLRMRASKDAKVQGEKIYLG